MPPTALAAAPVDTTDVTTYLTSKNIQVFRANGNEVTFHCLWCPDGDPKGKGKCYLNTDSWLYDCKRCGERGNRKTLLKHFGDEDTVAYTPGADPMARRKVLDESTELAHQMLLNNDEMLGYLVGRGLTAKTISEYKIGYVPESWSLSRSLPSDHTVADKISAGILTQGGHDFFKNRITIPYLSHGSCVQLRGKDPKGKYFTPSGESVRLFNADVLQNAEDVIITEGEFDCLVLQQTLQRSPDPRVRATAVVGIAGADALPSGFDSYFTQAKRVYIALDPDDTGDKAAIRIKEKLGSKARIVNLPTDLPKCDWTEYLVARKRTLADVLELLANASGRRLWSVGDAGAKWRRRQVEAAGIKTGFPELDAWFYPGLEAGDLIVPIAKTGVGKTNFLCNLAWYTRERPTLFISMEMMASQVYDRLRRIAHFWYPLANDDEIDEMYSLLRIVDENRLREGDISILADEYADEVGVRPQQAYMDYLGYYSKGCRGVGSYEKTTNASMELKAEGKSAELAVVAPHQVNRQAEDGKPLDASDARDSGAVEETADLMVGLYRPQDAIAEGAPSSVVRMGVLKNRKNGKGMATNLNFGLKSLVLVPQNTEAARMVDEENRLVWRGEEYPAIRAFRKQQAMSTHQLTLAQ
jgi:5S rRNA maturation endonuclease (ribonuclease M5)